MAKKLKKQTNKTEINITQALCVLIGLIFIWTIITPILCIIVFIYAGYTAKYEYTCSNCGSKVGNNNTCIHCGVEFEVKKQKTKASKGA